MSPDPNPNKQSPAVGIDGKPVSLPFKSADQSGPAQVPEKQKEAFAWIGIIKRARRGAIAAVLALLILVAGAVVVIYRFLPRQQGAPEIENQSVDVKSIPTISLGREGEQLTVGADATFKGKVVVGGDIDIVGRLNAGTPLVVPSLEVPGTTNLSTAEISSNLNVAGTSSLQGNVTVSNLLTVAGNLNVTGNGSLGGNLNTGNLSARSVTVSGTLTLGGHVISGGATPTVSSGPAVGGAGTVSISGNDRAGTVTINTGTLPPFGVLANVSFRAPYAATPRVIVTPIGSSTGALDYYVTRSVNGFSIATLNPPAAGAGFAFDYIVEQ
jgi:hypothetical protein